MQSDIYEMAVGSYGYGCWNAPYWFIGPEQGMARDEDIRRRVDAWINLGRGKEELNDCRKFHGYIKDSRWHDEKQLQKTWKQLMLLLMAFRGTPKDLNDAGDKESLRSYQADCWGSETGETCVIELFGLPANSYRTSKKQKSELFDTVQLADIRERRIAVIRDRILTHKPKLVVMYGRKEMEHWKRIARVMEEFPMSADRPIFTFPTHPVSFEGVTNMYWNELGKSLRG